MKFPLWLRYSWWLVILGAAILGIVLRRDSIFGTAPTSIDLLIISIAIALAAIPIFAEISVAGVGFKQHLEEAKKELKSEIQDVRNEIRTSIDVSNRLTQSFYLAPPPDHVLEEAEKRAQAVVERARDRARIPGEEETPPEWGLSPDLQTLVLARPALEREIRRLWWRQNIELDTPARYLNVGRMISDLLNRGVVTQDLAGVLREVYSVCSAAVHGEEPSQAQVNYVLDVLPGLLAALRSM